MSLLAVTLAVVILAGKATSKYCDGDYFCTPPKECCTLGCCYLYSQPTPNIFNLIIWNHWYLWCVIVVGVCVCCGVCACGVWRRKSHASRGGGGGGGVRGGGGGGGGGGRGGGGDACSEVDSQSAGSCYQPPPHYSRCSSFHQPPPYNEVTSKPDLYPLVISYSDTGKTNVGGSYLMVHYFRNYIMRPVGSLSATSTADSLSSSLFCNAVNEANSLVPPPYSSAPGSVDQINLHSSPLHQVLSQSESHRVGGMLTEAEVDGGGSDQLLSAVSSVAGPLGGASPPQATTPTLQHAHAQQQQQLIYKMNQLPSSQAGGSSGGRLKLSLSRGCRHWLSRSAPATPSTRLAPLPFPSQESSPLLLSTNSNEEEEEEEGGAEGGLAHHSSSNLEDSIF